MHLIIFTFDGVMGRLNISYTARLGIFVFGLPLIGALNSIRSPTRDAVLGLSARRLGGLAHGDYQLFLCNRLRLHLKVFAFNLNLAISLVVLLHLRFEFIFNNFQIVQIWPPHEGI